VTARAPARHRAPVRPTTPLSGLTSTVTDQVGNIGRGGVVIAMSSGLVASMGVPASAVGRSTSPEAVPVTALIAARPALASQSGSTTAPAHFRAGTAAPRNSADARVNVQNRASRAVHRVISPNLSADGQIGSGLSSGFAQARGSSVLAVASRYLGVKYRYGGSSPIGWDCSGAMQYIYNQIGVKLPRTAHQQMLASHRIPRSQARPGDLVFMISAGTAYHVGTYAGGNQFWDAGRTGRSFTKREIFSSNVVFGRVL
jgi:cell wall-associated NlpC family hydrolase